MQTPNYRAYVILGEHRERDSTGRRQGAIDHDVTYDMPPGATNPGHYFFVREFGIEAVVVTCNGSGHIVTQPVAYN